MDRNWKHGDLVAAQFQTSGRGRRGSAWESDYGKNLLFSMFLQPDGIVPSRHFLVSFLGCLSVREALESIIPGVAFHIKWPNDVLAGGGKLCGTLAETMYSHSSHGHPAFCVGIGVNINQQNFRSPSATSLRSITGKDFEPDLVLASILQRMDEWAERVCAESASRILEAVNQHLMWRGESRSFLVKGKKSRGVIEGVSERGDLVVRIAGTPVPFASNQIKLIG